MIWAQCTYDCDQFKNGQTYPVVGLDGGACVFVDAHGMLTGVAISEVNNPAMWVLQPIDTP